MSQSSNNHHGGYRSLVAFQLTTVIYDATVAFCNRFLDAKTRTIDQMIQAARSGRQNIAEGSRSGDADTERKLIAVARASLEELLLDYEDYLRQNALPQWSRNQQEAVMVRNVWREHHPEMSEKLPADTDWRALDDEHNSWYKPWLANSPAAVHANAVICIIHQANYRLDHMLNPKADVTGPGTGNVLCPVCGAEMVLRKVRNGPSAGNEFWGCSRYPACSGTRAR